MKTFIRRRAFTLIELLVVIVIIVILSGIVLRTTTLVGRKAGVSRAEYELQQIENALNEFYAEYGHYPPVDFMEYEYENSNLQTPWFRGTFLPAHNDPNDPANFFADKERPVGELGYTTHDGWWLGYRYGLVSYLYSRARGAQPHWYDEDTARDTAAKERWHHFIDDIGPERSPDPDVETRFHPTPPGLMSQAEYSDSVATVRDPWGAEYRYISLPPFQSYRLWSYGPDGTDNTDDDLHRAAE